METQTLSQAPDFSAWANEAEGAYFLDEPQFVAVDTETEGLEFHHLPFCVTMSWRSPSEAMESHYFELGIPGVDDVVKNILASAPALVMHNSKFDVQKLILSGHLERESVQSSRLHDTECIVHLLDEQRRKGLKELARTLLGEETDEEEAIRVACREAKIKKADGYKLLPREIIIPYALKDTEFTLRIFEQQWPLLNQHDDLMLLYAREQELMLILLDMESRGMGLDVEYLQRTVKEYAGQIMRVELDIRDIAGEEFNPNSPKQIVEAFLAFDIAVDGSSREVLGAVDHPLAAKLLELRALKKLHGTYLKPMLQEQRDGIIHPWFRQHGTKTGRMSSGGASAE